MALTKSKMVELGSLAPNFSLVDTISGNIVSSPKKSSCKAMLVMFICNHCPYVKHIAKQLAALGSDYNNSEVKIYAISSNDPEQYPADAPELMNAEAKLQGYTFPYLYDESQSVAKDFGAECTPDFFLYDSELKLVYRGQLDSSTPGSNLPVTGADLRAAINAVLEGRAPVTKQYPSMGCNIKWR